MAITSFLMHEDGFTEKARTLLLARTSIVKVNISNTTTHYCLETKFRSKMPHLNDPKGPSFKLGCQKQDF